MTAPHAILVILLILSWPTESIHFVSSNNSNTSTNRRSVIAFPSITLVGVGNVDLLIMTLPWLIAKAKATLSNEMQTAKLIAKYQDKEDARIA